MSMTYVGDQLGDQAKWLMIGGNLYNNKTEQGEASDQVWLLELGRGDDFIWTRVGAVPNPEDKDREKNSNFLSESTYFPPRFQHAACSISAPTGKKAIQVNGGFFDMFYRYLTTHILTFTAENQQFSEYSWALPIDEESQFNFLPKPDNNFDNFYPTEEGAGPSPRGRHTATYVDGKVYLIGGHGGSLYARQYFDETWIFDLETKKYEKMVSTGGKLIERCSHTANLMHDGKSIMVYGGWNNKVMFSDVCILDTEKREWLEVEASSQMAKYLHSSLMIEAIPHWRFFVFGGSELEFNESEKREYGKYSNNVLLQLVESESWQDVALDDTTEGVPERRNSSAIMYDIKKRRMVVYGGFSNEWLDDMWALDVSQIVGPSYSIERIEPARGPISGKIPVIVYGKGFHEGPRKWRLLFKVGNKWEEASEVNRMSNTELEVLTPNFRKYGPRAVEVYIKEGEDLVSVTKTQFSFFVDTMCEKSCAYGPGIHTVQNAGEDTIFIINARDEDGNNRTSGRDQWRVKILDKVTKEEIPHNIVDSDTGNYDVHYVVDRCTTVVVDVMIDDSEGVTKHLNGFPCEVKFEEPTEETKGLNSLEGNLIVNYIKDKTDEIQLFIAEKNKALNIEERSDYISNVHTLLDVKQNFNKVIEKQKEYERTLDQLYEYIVRLTHKKELKGQDSKIKESQKEWVKISKHADKLKKDLENIVKSEGEKNNQNIQNFEEELKSDFKNLTNEAFTKFETGTEVAYEGLDQFNVKLERRGTELEYYQNLANGFDEEHITLGCKAQYEKMAINYKSMRELWDHIKLTLTRFNDIYNMPFKEANTDNIEDTYRDLNKKFGLIKNVKDFPVSKTFKGILNAWPGFIQNLNNLKEKYFNNRHWDMLVKEVQKPDFDFKNDKMTVREVWDLKMEVYQEAVDDIFERSKQEFKMDTALDKYEEYYKTVEFDYAETKSYKDIKLITFNDDAFNALEEQVLQVYNFNNNRFKDFLEEKINSWLNLLNLMTQVIENLKYAQTKWSFLEKMFVQAPEVKKELGVKAEEFVKQDELMKEILRTGMSTPNVRKFCEMPQLNEKLKTLKDAFDDAEDYLNRNYLKLKKNKFPRFYFVSEDDLLYMLSNSNTPSLVIEQVNKVILNMKTVTLKEDAGGGRPTAIDWVSAVGIEKLNYSRQFVLNGKTEEYLDVVLKETSVALKDLMNDSQEDYSKKKRYEWVQDNKSSQITLLISLIFWCVNIEKHMVDTKKDSNAMDKCTKLLQSQLEDLIRLVQGKIDKPMRTRVMCMITLDAHARDISGQLHDEKCFAPDGFQWQAQLKAYYNPDKKDADMHICDAHFMYGYEYLGNGPRLVVTPLTDRIYVTATQALHLKMGCAPAGPAGTGKTESTKDLANALAKACYVFNCAPEMNYETLGGIQKGLAASGAWGCFDEFNRLIPEVLSVCAFQFGAVCDAIKENAATVEVEGETLTLDPTCGAFITMNPGYLGRSELPEKLKALFRPITVMVPDLILICENFLMAEGFVEAKDLALKFFTLYNLSKSLLSPAMHYDWGLRAIKTVLVVAGAFKRAEPEVSESDMLMRVLRDINIPKQPSDDQAIFTGLLNDLFPGQNPPQKIDEQMYEQAKQALTDKMGLYPEDAFIQKVLQLSDVLVIRHCVFMMGNPGSFKSTCWKTCAEAQTIKGEPTKIIDINPKSISASEFYGDYNSGGSWKQGIFSQQLKELGKEKDTNPKWIILDGDLDANWIESMNSVMDDNKILTLANSDRIVMYGHMRMLLEIRDLRFATPATVSRGGVIQIYDDEGWQWKSYCERWLADCKLVHDMKAIGVTAPKQKEAMDSLRNFLMSKYLPRLLDYSKKNFKRPFPMYDINLVITTLKIFDAIFILGKDDERLNFLEQWFALACVWSFGGSVSLFEGEDYKRAFSKFFLTEQKGIIKLGKSVFDCFIDEKNNEFAEWSDILKETPFDSSKQSITSVVIDTSETTAFSYFIKKLIAIDQPTLVIGPTGSGKSQLINGVLQKLPKNKYTNKTINFNFQTDGIRLQLQLESVLKKQGKTFKPLAGGDVTLLYFVDDLNMPATDPYDTQSSIALIRQSIDYNHWYDREKVELKMISNTMYISAMNPTAGIFYVNPRLMRHFWILQIMLPDNQSMIRIYKTFVSNHFKNFNKNVLDEAEGLCKSALILHQEVMNKFKKTSANFHYEFNIRHLTGVFLGILQAKPEYYKDADKIAKLWVHESERIYGDRLVSEADVKEYLKLSADVVKKNIKHPSVSQQFNEKDPKLLCFAPFNDDFAYNDIDSIEKLRKKLEEELEGYNDCNAVMDLVLFDDACKHTAKISRIVMSESGHALLVGVGGSGKQSLSRLASWCNKYVTVGIVVTSDYTEKMLKEDIQEFYKKAALKNEGILWLMTEGQIIDERFLVFINDLLASGEISGLFPDDEIDNIVGALTNAFKAECPGQNVDKESVQKFFITRIRKNLHISLCFSPVGENLRVKARKFPGLVNSSVIDWFQKWPKDALLSVSRKFLDEMELGTPEVKESIIKFMPESFEIVQKESDAIYQSEKREVFTTPKSFIELLKLYKNKFSIKKTGIENNKEKQEVGVKLLEDIQETVAELNKILEVKKVEVDAKKAEAEKIEAIVKVEKDKVEKESASAQITLDEAKNLKDFIENKKADIEGKIAVAMPKVQETLEKLDKLDKKEVDFIKNLASPDDKIKQIMQVVMHLFTNVDLDCKVQSDGKGKIDLTWPNAKKLINNPGKFVEDLKKYGKEEVRNNKVKFDNFVKAKKLIAEEELTVELLTKKSAAAATFCEFAINIIEFAEVIRMVGPMEEELKELGIKLEKANEDARISQETVDRLNAELKKLIDEYEKVNATKEAALAEAKVFEDKAGLAERLINALKAEQDRWKESIIIQQGRLNVASGDVMLSAAFISQIGPFSKNHRINIMNNFLKFSKDNRIPISDPFDPIEVFADAATIAEWNNNYLPADFTSSQNGMILMNSERWPLIIDPQLQGLKWLKEQFKDNLANLKMTDKTWKNDLFNGIESGKIIVFENLEEKIDATIMPVIGRNQIKRGSNKVLKIGDRELNVHPEFRMQMQTKLSNPKQPPEIQAECTLINFSVTEEGLEDQLLAYIIRLEREDLANTKEDLVKKQREQNIQLANLENSLLTQLKEQTGDILANVALVDNLEKSKVISDDIKIKVAEGKKTEADIALFSEKQRPSAERGALVFFLFNELYKIHSFYAFSLRSFMFVIKRAVLIVQSDWDKKDEPEPKEGGGEEDEENAEEQPEEAGNDGPKEFSDEELDRRISDLTESITLTAWDQLRRGLFDKHKVVIISILCFRIKVKKGLIPQDQQQCLISNKMAEPGVPQPQQLKFMQEINWLMIRGLEGALYSDLTKNMTNVSVEWSKWYEKPNPESGGFPKYVNEKSDFEKLLFLRALRADRMEQALKNYVQNEMDSEYTKRRGVGQCDKPPFNMAQAMLESDCSIPLFFVLFPGVEPTGDIRSVGQKYNKSIGNNTLIEISMGQGQEERANKALVQAAQDGNWVALNNIHLMTTWTRVLELKLDEVTPTAHEEFRCFLSSEAPPLPHMQIIPESILQNALKVSNEAPQDVKSNMLRAYGLFSQARIDECTKKVEQKAILFGLCTFHSFILARKKFGSQGWSRMYSFNDGDLTICGDILRNYLNRYDLIPWDDLRYLFGEIMYGGHITDFWDRRTNNAYLRVLIKPELMERYVISTNFTAPDANKTEYDDYIKQVNDKIPPESPELIKINNLAEIGQLTNVSNFIFETILNLSGSGSGSGKTEKIEDTISTQLNNPGLKSIDTLAVRARKDITPFPFDIVLVQECEQVNVLIGTIKSSLEDLLKGCRGELGVTDAMEKLQVSLNTGKVPAIWQKQGQDTAKGLMAWYGDLLMRIDHQQKWADIIQPNPQFPLPQCVWIAGFFNPLKFLTACTQVVARQKGLALDNMSISTVVTEFNSVEEAKLEENECALIYGMQLEGADWEAKAERGEGYLKVYETKKIHPDLPVVEIRPVDLKEKLERYTRGYYTCPVFKTGGRGATFVWAANLKMRDDNEPEDFWTLCSTSLLLADD